MGNSQLFYTVLGLVKEASWGAGGTPSKWLPITDPKFQPQNLRHSIDQGFRGEPSAEYDLIAGPGEGSFSFGGPVFVDSTPYLLDAIMGTPSVGGTVSPYTHTFKVGATPHSYLLEWQQNVQSYQFEGARLSQMVINFSAKDGTLTYTCQGMSKLGTEVVATAASFSAINAMPGWKGTVTVAGGAPASLLEGSITLERPLSPLHALNNTQDIAALYPGSLKATARLTFDFTGTTEYDYYAAAAATLNALVLSFVQTTNSAELIFTFTKAGWRLVDLEPRDNLYSAVGQVNGVRNATDAGPLAITIKNTVATYI